MANQEQIDQIIDMVKDIKVAMLVSKDLKNTELRSRPMHVVQIEGDATIWFFTSRYSEKVHETIMDQEVNLAFADRSSASYISISGQAELIKSKSKISELWSNDMRAWFPEGKDSDKLALLKVSPTSAEYWDDSNSSMVRFLKLGKALITGERYEEKEHEEVSL